MEIIVENLSVHTEENCRLGAISFHLKDGDHAVVTGVSGSGKTTLFRVLTGLEPEYRGKAVFWLEEKGELTPQSFRDQEGIGFLFQENRLLPERSAVENVRITLRNEIADAAIRQELSKVLPETDPDRSAGKLSGGEQRRVALVRAMLQKSKVILLDEPFSGLDEGAGDLVKKYISEKSEGRIVLASDHEGFHFPDWIRINVASGNE